jgi:hypothetical protein
MTLMNLSIALTIVLGFLYWLNAMNTKQLAVQLAKRACAAEGVQFLDDTVVLLTLRFQRNTRGGVSIFRRYRFEFASDGGHRYSGEVDLLGQQLQQLSLQVYRIH